MTELRHQDNRATIADIAIGTGAPTTDIVSAALTSLRTWNRLGSTGQPVKVSKSNRAAPPSNWRIDLCHRTAVLCYPQ